MKICLLGYHAAYPLDPKLPWHPGDPVIASGIMNLLPALWDHDLIAWADNPNCQVPMEEALSCDYMIVMGSPAWIRKGKNVEFYEKWMASGKRFSMVGVGMGHAWNEHHDLEEPIRAIAQYQAAGMVDVLATRDQICYHLFRRLGADEDIFMMPCPGFYALKPGEPVKSKKIVALDIADPHNWHEHGGCDPSASFEEHMKTFGSTYYQYYERMAGLHARLKTMGADVRLCTHTRLAGSHDESSTPVPTTSTDSSLSNNNRDILPSRLVLLNALERFFPNEVIHWMPNQSAFENFYAGIEVYIGTRVHGVLPAAGIGKPSFGIGVDNRQWAWEQVPHIARLDMRYGSWNIRTVLDWYGSVDALSVSNSLLHFRSQAEASYMRSIQFRAKLSRLFAGSCND